MMSAFFEWINSPMAILPTRRMMREEFPTCGGEMWVRRMREKRGGADTETELYLDLIEA